MTGTGAYMYIVWGIWLRHCLNGRQDEYALVWPRLYNFPDIVRVRKELPCTPKQELPTGEIMKAN